MISESDEVQSPPGLPSHRSFIGPSQSRPRDRVFDTSGEPLQWGSLMEGTWSLEVDPWNRFR